MLGSEKVCVKMLRVYNMKTDDQKQTLSVCDIRNYCVRFANADAVQAFLRRSGRLEEAEASKRCSLLGSNDGAVTARVQVDA